MANRNYEVVPYRYWKRDDGKTASLHGAVPYVSETEKVRWTIVEDGFTLYNPNSNTYGIGRQPFKTRQEAEDFAATHRAPRTSIGD